LLPGAARVASLMKHLLAGLLGLFCAGCTTTSRPPLATVPSVDLPRFMGPWYVIACIPTFLETNAYNAIEDYALAPDGTIATTFTFNEGSFDGPVKTYHPRGFVRDPVNRSTWGMQFLWPIKAEFLITHLDPDYTRTVIGRNRRDYVWIMARTPTMAPDVYDGLVRELAAQGYDTSKLRRVPHRAAAAR